MYFPKMIANYLWFIKLLVMRGVNYFMKRCLILLISFLMSLSLVACDKEEEKNEFQIFGEKFNELYPEGYLIPNGWYKEEVTSTLYNVYTGERENKSWHFIGEVDFDSINYSGEIKRGKLVYVETKYNDFDEKMVVYSRKVESYMEGNRVFRKVEVNDGKSKLSYTEGMSNVDVIYFSAEHSTDYNNMDLLQDYAKWNRWYQDVNIEIRGQGELTIISTVYGMGEWYLEGESYRTDRVFFDENCQLVRTIRIERGHYFSEVKQDNVIVRIFEHCEPIEIVVPTIYDKEMEEGDDIRISEDGNVKFLVRF